MFLLDDSFWEVRQTEKKGRGIFAKKDITAGTIIGDYLGKLIRPKDEPNDLQLYNMYFSDKATILPDPQTIGIHILNHSCMPNCGGYTYKNHMLYFALRKIFEGEELTVSYDLGPPDNDCNPCTHACYCNTILCRGSWHTSEETMQLWKKIYDGDADEILNTEPPVPYGEMLPKLTEYPSTIEDNPNYEVFANTDKKPQIMTETKLLSSSVLRKSIRKNGVPLFFTNLDILVTGMTPKTILIESQNSNV